MQYRKNTKFDQPVQLQLWVHEPLEHRRQHWPDMFDLSSCATKLGATWLLKDFK